MGYRSKKKAFTKHNAGGKPNANNERELAKMKKYCKVIRVLVHSDIVKLPLAQKKAHLMEVQINGGDIATKVDYGVSLFEQSIPVSKIFKVLLPVGELLVFQERPTKVSERSLVLVLGIQAESSTLFHVLVKTVTITVPKSTRKFTKLLPLNLLLKEPLSKTTKETLLLIVMLLLNLI